VTALPTHSSADYARKARRLRATLKDQPARLHRALRDLQPAPLAEPLPRAMSNAEQFAEVVRQLLHNEAGLLRYSARLKLLRGAQRMGIDRFEANLIIAAVQQQSSWQRPAPAVSRPRRDLGLVVSLAATALVAIEGMVVLAAWWIAKL
jgi:hypothetical protein